jgi:hypothetical protein
MLAAKQPSPLVKDLLPFAVQVDILKDGRGGCFMAGDLGKGQCLPYIQIGAGAGDNTDAIAHPVGRRCGVGNGATQAQLAIRQQILGYVANDDYVWQRRFVQVSPHLTQFGAGGA